jgi:hypothetical protein
LKINSTIKNKRSFLFIHDLGQVKEKVALLPPFPLFGMIKD